MGNNSTVTPYKIKHRDFKVGDLVLRKVIGATRDPAQGKLSPN